MKFILSNISQGLLEETPSCIESVHITFNICAAQTSQDMLVRILPQQRESSTDAVQPAQYKEFEQEMN